MVSNCLISIHALREEGDASKSKVMFVDNPISIHALREEGDCLDDVFNYVRDISIHALREEGDFYITEDVSLKSGISIHALREEGDDMIYQFTTTYAKFLSTPSARRATGPYEEDKKDFHLFLSTPSARRATIE